MEYNITEISQTQKLAEKIAKEISENTVILLFGDLGSGKTTFSRFFSIAMGSENRVQSPTFVIHRQYIAPNNENVQRINHYDLYRITNKAELEDLSIYEALNEPEQVSLVEWPELLEKTQITAKIISIEFEDNNGKRIAKINTNN